MHKLEMRPGCERCDTDLPPQSDAARICSFECTFCSSCTDGPLAGRCPNCGGELLKRPTRAEGLLREHPPMSERIYNPVA